MKKCLIFVVLMLCIFGIVSCGQQKYKVQIADNYPIENELKSSYAAGEEVTIQLVSITEHYYELYINGVKQEINKEISDWRGYTYFTFTMPEEDVLITIEDRWVDIPDGPL